jgi:ribose 5-phosphate isomerase B
MKKLITEEDVKKILKQGGSVVVITKNSVITPLAKDYINSKKLKIIIKESDGNIQTINQSNNQSSATVVSGKRIALGSDHTGFRLKNILLKYLTDKGHIVNDLGTYDEKPCDYPDFAKKVAMSVSLNENDFGILIDATGIPSAITANKIKGSRAATCYNTFSARSSRAHNDANILVVGSKALGEETIKLIVDEWLSTTFEGGRHQKRLEKIRDIENEKS